MRQVVWLLMMFAIAVLAASTLGANDGLVSIYWAPWRVDLSINVFVLLLLAAGFVGHVLTGAVSGLIDLPQRARQWRTQQREAGEAVLCVTTLQHPRQAQHEQRHGKTDEEEILHRPGQPGDGLSRGQQFVNDHGLSPCHRR